VIRIVFLLASFWVALQAFRRCHPTPGESIRFVLGLGLSALLAHLGWAALHLDALRAQPWAILDLSTGFTVLAVPLGLQLSGWGAGPRHLSAALGALPLALVTARAGCLFQDCCSGIPTGLSWPLHHPTALYEMMGLALLQLGVRQLSRRERFRAFVAPWVLVGFGLIRLAVEPFRAIPPLGPPSISPCALAAGWVAVGLLVAARAGYSCHPATISRT
jgi:hypothetical protein